MQILFCIVFRYRQGCAVKFRRLPKRRQNAKNTQKLNRKNVAERDIKKLKTEKANAVLPYSSVFLFCGEFKLGLGRI